MPDLGGIETTLEKRTRHRRALLRLLYEYHGTDRMVICLDPGAFDLLQDFCTDRAVTRLLEIDCAFSDDYLIGHARRVGLAGASTPRETLERLLPTVRYDIRFESDRIRDGDFAGHFRLRESAGLDENAAAIAGFLGVLPDMAREIAATEHLFWD